MADYEGVDSFDFTAETLSNFNSFPTRFSKRDVWQAGQVQTAAAAGTTIQNIFRGVLGGQYVYSTGTPPVGATDVVVVGTTES